MQCVLGDLLSSQVCARGKCIVLFPSTVVAATLSSPLSPFFVLMFRSALPHLSPAVVNCCPPPPPKKKKKEKPNSFSRPTVFFYYSRQTHSQGSTHEGSAQPQINSPPSFSQGLRGILGRPSPPFLHGRKDYGGRKKYSLLPIFLPQAREKRGRRRTVFPSLLLFFCWFRSGRRFVRH